MRVERRRAKVHAHAPEGATAPLPPIPTRAVRAFSLDLMETAEELFAIASLAEQVEISRKDPERFHMVKDQVARRLRRIAGRIRAEALPVTDNRTWRPYGR